MFSFSENIAREFGKDTKPRNLAKYEKELESKKEIERKALERLERDSQKLKENPNDSYCKAQFNEAYSLYEKRKAERESFEKALYSGDVFGQNTPDENLGLIKCEGDISLTDIYDVRVTVDNKTPRVVAENYGDDTMASLVEEGGAIQGSDFVDYVTTISTDREDVDHVANILNVPESFLEDDKELLDCAIDSVQKKHSGNRETMLLCQAIKESKESIGITIETLLSKVNSHLSARAKLNTEIITNESGFEKLDVVDENGNPLVKKNFSIGEFVFADKYIIRTISDNILPNNEDDTTPIFIGDWKNVLRLVVTKKYPPLEKLDLWKCMVENRAIEHVVPLLTTTSDRAYIVAHFES